MPSIKYRNKAELYNNIRSESDRFNERSDCSVVAVAAATSEEYSKVHALMKKHGRKDRSGTPLCVTEATVKELGFTLEKIHPEYFIQKYPGVHKNLKNVTSHHPDRFNKAWKDGYNYIVWNRTHMLAICNGVNVDWTRGRAFRITGIWRITKGGSGEEIDQRALREQAEKKYREIQVEKFRRAIRLYTYKYQRHYSVSRVNASDWACEDAAKKFGIGFNRFRKFLDTGRVEDKYQCIIEYLPIPLAVRIEQSLVGGWKAMCEDWNWSGFPLGRGETRDDAYRNLIERIEWDSHDIQFTYFMNKE